MEEVRIVSLTICHYGADFLTYALRSVHAAVDAQYVLYTPEGSHGHKTSAINPDTREQLIECAIAGAGSKLRWHEGVYANESEHRGKIHELEPDADIILVTDADELWDTPHITSAIINKPYFEQAGIRRLRVPMVHFWRSFYRCVINDHSYPERVIYPKHINGEAQLTLNGQSETHIAHMGYAQRSEVVKYKILTHGHKNDWRADWYDTKWLPNAQVDVHPTNVDFWKPETVNPFDYMPAWMCEHPYAKLELIP